MFDILYQLSIRDNLSVIVKKDTFVVGFNATDAPLQSLVAFEEIEYSTTDAINHITSVRAYPYNKFILNKRSPNERELFEIQNAQLALELEREVDRLYRSFPIKELGEAFLPALMLADILKNHADYELPALDFPAIAASLVTHADHVIRQRLDRIGRSLPDVNLAVDASISANASIPAARLTLDWLQNMLDSFVCVLTEEAEQRTAELKSG